MSLATFLLALGASLRLVRLFVEDTITQGLRDFLARRSTTQVLGQPTGQAKVALWLVQLFECPWCLGFWTAAAVTAVAAASDGAGWFAYPAIALTISYLIGVTSTIVATIEEIN